MSESEKDSGEGNECDPRVSSGYAGGSERYTGSFGRMAGGVSFCTGP